MLKSKTKKGFTLIEVMVGIAIFSILFSATMTLQLGYMRLKLHNEKMNNYRFYIETVRNRMLYDISYNKICELRNSSKIYINKNHINLESLRNEDIMSIFDPSVESEKLYIKADIEGGEVLKIELKLNTLVLGKMEAITCEFYKGAY